jgi:hypothetical protein
MPVALKSWEQLSFSRITAPLFVQEGIKLRGKSTCRIPKENLRQLLAGKRPDSALGHCRPGGVWRLQSRGVGSQGSSQPLTEPPNRQCGPHSARALNQASGDLCGTAIAVSCPLAPIFWPAARSIASGPMPLTIVARLCSCVRNVALRNWSQGAAVIGQSWRRVRSRYRLRARAPGDASGHQADGPILTM